MRLKENAGMLAEYIMLETTNQAQLPVVHPAEEQFTLLCWISVLMVMIIKSTVFYDVMPCNLVEIY